MANPGKIHPQEFSSSVLFCSRIEITRILQALVNENTAVFTSVGATDEEQLFVSHVLSVKPDDDCMVLAYSAEKTINSALFKNATLKLKANYQSAYIAFAGYKPADTVFEGQPAVQFAFPRALLQYHREYKRISIPREVALHCISGAEGKNKLEMKIVDISQEGMGCMLYHRASTLRKGTVLRNCHIDLPDGKFMVADLMVRHSTPTILPDGTCAYRTGFRFVQTPDEIKPLIEQFIRTLDDTTR